MNEGSNSGLHSLLSADGRELVNIKLWVGTKAGLTVEAVEAAACEAIHKGFLQLSGQVTPKSGRPAMTIAESAAHG